MFSLELRHLEAVFGDPIVISDYLEYSGHIRTVRFWRRSFCKKKADLRDERYQVQRTEYSVGTRNIP